MAAKRITHLSADERKAQGEGARGRTPPSSHRGWRPAADRPDPVALLEEQNVTREPDLVPVRHGRMMVSPFTFYRGAAKIMAADLKDTPTAGLGAQLCGDAHLSNFGVFASPERRLLFDLNDFDETLPGPFEYDVKRMAASFTIAARNNGFSKADARAVDAGVGGGVPGGDGRSSRGCARWTSGTPTSTEDELMAAVRGTVAETGRKGRKAGRPRRRRPQAGGRRRPRRRPEAGGEDAARRRTPATACRRCPSSASWSTGGTGSSASRRSSSPAATWPPPTACPPTRSSRALHEQFRAYRATLQDDRRHLLERFEIVDMARKVVGRRQRRHPGVHRPAAGTRRAGPAVPAGQGGDRVGAGGSPAEEPLPAARRAGGAGSADDAGRQRHLPGLDARAWTCSRHFYWRQLRDMKGSALVEAMSPVALTFYARICGWTLARAHARSGDPVAIAEYLGDDDAFDRSITDFSERYADQNEQDFQEFVKASGPAGSKRARACEERASAPWKTLRTGRAGGGIGVCWPGGSV